MENVKIKDEIKVHEIENSLYNVIERTTEDKSEFYLVFGNQCLSEAKSTLQEATEEKYKEQTLFATVALIAERVAEKKFFELKQKETETTNN